MGHGNIPRTIFYSYKNSCAVETWKLVLTIKLTDPSPSASKSTSVSFNKVDQHTTGKQQNKHKVDTKSSGNALTSNINNIVQQHILHSIYVQSDSTQNCQRPTKSFNYNKQKPNLTPRGGKVSPYGSQKTCKRAPKTPKCLPQTPKKP